MPVKLSYRVAAAALAAVAAVPGCTSSSSMSSSTSGGSGSSSLSVGSSVVVGFAPFPEDELLAEIYAQALRGAGVKVTRLNIGFRETYYRQVKSGAISIVPEYNGALLTTSVYKSSPAVTTAQVDAALAAKLPSTLEVLRPSSATDSDSVTVTRSTAAKYHLTTIADLAPYAKDMAIGGPPEFKTRIEGLIGLKKNYGLIFKSFVRLDDSGPMTLAALASGKVQAADVFTTTPQIISDHLVVLSDSKNNFAAQNVIPLVYRKAMTPTIVARLNAVDAKLTTASLLQLDNAVITEDAPLSVVAAAFLKEEGL
jgi:osmoprotectant transport system substrate-binding protein